MNSKPAEIINTNEEQKEVTKLDKLFKDFDGNIKDHKVEVDWGNPVGKEVY